MKIRFNNWKMNAKQYKRINYKWIDINNYY